MQKLQIKAQRALNGQFFYYATKDQNTAVFPTFEAARLYGWRKIKRERKEASAFAMLCNISMNFLSVKDAELVQKLKHSKAVGISPRQYGYLKGIYERQERAW